MPLALPPQAVLARHLGPFRLDNAWELRGRYFSFGGFSGLVMLPQRRLLAVADFGVFLEFTPPGEGPMRAVNTELGAKVKRSKFARDTESIAFDQGSAKFWVGFEQVNAVGRLNAMLEVEELVYPVPMKDWPENSGPEAMARLDDGRFVILCECEEPGMGEKGHPGVLFSGDPASAETEVRSFVADGPEGFAPTDMAQLPDGRVLVLMRRLVWPLPWRFAGRIAIGDPKEIRPDGRWKLTEVAALSSSLPIDNFEGMAIAPAERGRIEVWLISDDNLSDLQRTLLWKLTVDPADLP